MNQKQEIEIDKLRKDKCNIREDWNQDPELTQDVKDNDVLNPLLVRPLHGEFEGFYGIVCGSRRFNASVDAGKKLVPCSIEEMDDLTAYGRSVSENKNRKDLDPSAYVDAIGEMFNILKPEMPTVGTEKIVAEISRKTGLGRSSVQNYIKLSQELSESSKELLKEPEQRSEKVKKETEEIINHYCTGTAKPDNRKLTVNEALALTNAPKEKQMMHGVLHPKVVEMIYKNKDPTPTTPKPQEDIRTTDEKARNEADEEFNDYALEIFLAMWCDSGHDGWSHHGLVKGAPDSEKIDSIIENVCEGLGIDRNKWIENCVTKMYYAEKKSDELDAKIELTKKPKESETVQFKPESEYTTEKIREHTLVSHRKGR